MGGKVEDEEDKNYRFHKIGFSCCGWQLITESFYLKVQTKLESFKSTIQKKQLISYQVVQ